MPVYVGRKVQRGHGLGNILGGLLRRFILQFVKSHGKQVLANVFKTGMKVADDVIEGKKFKESAKKRIPSGIKRTFQDMIRQSQSGSGVGRKKKRVKRRNSCDRRRQNAITRHIFVMAFVHELSCECTKSELDLFSVPPPRRPWNKVAGSNTIR